MKEVGPLVFNREGIYKYKLYQRPESKKPGYKHDERKYTIEMYISEKLDADVIVLNEDGTKAEKIMFMNEYINTLDIPDPDPDQPATDPDPPATNGSSPAMAPQGSGYLAKTGDDMNIMMYVSIIMFSGIMAVGLAFFLIKLKRGKRRSR
jgi:pilin isopeptide linkage protein